MPSDRDRGVLVDMLRHIDLAERFSRGHTLETFRSDELHLYAVTRCLEVISEASRRLSDDLKARHPSIVWKEMAAAGNVYRHDYQDVAALRIWDTVQLALPSLRAVIEQELGELPKYPVSSDGGKR
jgi:uncharacterized protein with HEPN domain